MNDDLAKVVVKVPETIVGEVSGELNRIVAWLDNMTITDGICAIEAQLPKSEVHRFKLWLRKTHNGEIRNT